MPKKKVATKSHDAPDSLQQAIEHFADPDNAHKWSIALRWPDGNIFCPFCGSGEHGYISTRRMWKCRNKECRKQFSARIGTIFEDSPIPFSKWFAAMWMLVNCKNGVSSYEIARALDVTQKTAWFMLHRIRRAIKAKSFDRKLSGIVEADETYIGGKLKNMHKSKREKINPGGRARGPVGKAIVHGILERDGEVRAQVIESLSEDIRIGSIRENTEEGSMVMTDMGCSHVGEEFIHQFINHEEEYVRGNVHTNGIENFWSLLKRTIRGTYVSVEPDHLSAYVDEQAFRFNQREGSDGLRFVKALAMTPGVRLTWKDLTRAN